MTHRFSPILLRRIRNEIPINTLIVDILDIPVKNSENYLRFLCPICCEFNTAINPKTNLARCFRCNKNFNPIDLVMTVNKRSFIDSIKILKPLLPS